MRDEMMRFASLDSAAAPGRNLLWRAHACMQRVQETRSDTAYPATDSLLRGEPACRALPFGRRSADGWQLTYRRTGDTAGYELRAKREVAAVRPIALYSRVLTHEIKADAAMIRAREGDGLATLSDPVIGSPLPMLVWVGWCLDQNQTTRDTGIEGYLLHIRPLGPGAIGCLSTPPFQFTADSDVVLVSVNGVEYNVRYRVGYLEGESLSSPGEDGEMHPILEWQFNTTFSMTATPARYGETGVRSYEIVEGSGTARAWATRARVDAGEANGYGSIEVPRCDWMRGISCEPQKPNPNDGSFGPGLEAFLHPAYIRTH